MPDERQDPGEILSFSQFVQNLDEGDLHHDLTNEISRIVAELNDARMEGANKPKAEMTIKLGFTLDGQTIDVTGDFATKLPRVKRERSVFWTTEKNRLSRSNPKQQTLPLKTVPTAPVADNVKAV
ncbi:MAG: hypothetical protein F8N39_11520 [Clostridiaceae bacterium]|nr:hypothetical protein [Clostridiaceae bacterium]